jgi:hypothetical protein
MLMNSGLSHIRALGRTGAWYGEQRMPVFKTLASRGDAPFRGGTAISRYMDLAYDAALIKYIRTTAPKAIKQLMA